MGEKKKEGPSKKGPVSIRFQFAFGLGAILLVLGAVVALLFYCIVKDPQPKDYFVFGAALTSALTAVGSFIYVGHNLSIQNDQRKLSAAFDQIDSACDPGFLEKRAALEAFADEKANKHKGEELGRAIFDQIKDDLAMRAKLKAVLGRFEIIALAIKLDVAREEPLYQTLGYVVPKTFDRFREYIAYVNTKNGRKDIWAELKWLAGRWQDRDD